jgi:hypothetical protein
MEEIVELVIKNVGITENQARGAVETVIEYLKERLPIGNQLDDLLKGAPGDSSSEAIKGISDDAGSADMLGNMGDLLGGLLDNDAED